MTGSSLIELVLRTGAALVILDQNVASRPVLVTFVINAVM